MTPDGRRVVSASEDRTLKVWDLEQGEDCARSRAMSSVSAAATRRTARGRCLADWDGTLKVWDLERGEALRTLEGHPTASVNAAAFTPDGKRALSALHSTLKVWDLDTATRNSWLTKGKKSVSCGPTVQLRQLH